MSSKNTKLSPTSNNNISNLPDSSSSTGYFLSSLFLELKPGESTHIQLKRNHDESATLRCSELGKTLVKRKSGNDVGYSYKPKKK